MKEIYRMIVKVDNTLIEKNRYRINKKSEVYDIKNDRFVSKRYDEEGYVYVSLSLESNYKGYTRYPFLVHRVMMNVFDPIDDFENMVVDHIDFDKHNNKLDNLRWITQKENIHHSIKNGRFDPNRISEFTRILKNKEVHTICKRFENGESPKEVHSDYQDKVKLTTLQKIHTGSIHSDIYNEYNIESKSNNYNYNWKDYVVPVCKLLEKDFTTREIADQLEFDTSIELERQKFWKFVKRLRERETYDNITQKYDY